MVPVLETAAELVHRFCLWTLTVHTEVGYFGQTLLATVAKVLSLKSVSLLHVKQLHHGLLTLHIITSVLSRQDEPYRVRLQTLVCNTLLYEDAIVRD